MAGTVGMVREIREATLSVVKSHYDRDRILDALARLDAAIAEKNREMQALRVALHGAEQAKENLRETMRRDRAMGSPQDGHT